MRHASALNYVIPILAGVAIGLFYALVWILCRMSDMSQRVKFDDINERDKD